MSDILTTSGAAIVGPYRYRLWREWDASLPRACFVMLNPSTADADTDDPTIRRCLGFARLWGCGRLDVVNLYALRATDPKVLSDHPDPVGPLNDEAIEQAAMGAWRIVAAWGSTVVKSGLSGTATARTALRAGHVMGALVRIAPVYALGTTASGQPRHPLYVKGDTKPFPLTWKG